MSFLQPSAWHSRQVPLQLVPLCDKCQLHKACTSPFMKPTGTGRRKVLIVAEAPGENEDIKGIQLCGNAGAEIMRILGNIRINMRKDCWLTNAVICRPSDGRGNREPTAKEVSWCRPNLANTIRELDPEIIIPLGAVAMQSLLPLIWKSGEDSAITRWVGWQIPVQKGNVWICPTYHPSHLLHANNEGANTIELHMTRHLASAFRLKGRPWKKVPDWEKLVELQFDPVKAARGVRDLTRKGVPLAFDFETTTLKPDGPNAEILCCSVSDGKVSIAFPWAGEAIAATRELVRNPKVPKIVSNLQFEERWCLSKLRTSVRPWQDTVLAAHWLDCRKGTAGLKFQSFVRFGMPHYDAQVENYRESIKRDDCNSPNRLKEVEPEVLLGYCGMDSLLEVKVWEDQMQEWKVQK